MRLFFAIFLPDEARERICALKCDVGHARWVRSDHLHLTLRFLGDVEEAVAERLATLVDERIASDGWARFSLRLAGLGTFGRPRPRVLYVGLEPAEPARRLAERLEGIVQEVGLPPEERGFQAHVTIARLKRPKRDALEALVGTEFESPSFEVDTLHLVASELTPEGPRYETWRRWALGPAVSEADTRPGAGAEPA